MAKITKSFGKKMTLIFNGTTFHFWIIDWLFQNDRASRVFGPSQGNGRWEIEQWEMENWEMDECYFLDGERLLGGKAGIGRKVNAWGVDL